VTETTRLFKMILTDNWDVSIWQVVGEITVAFAQLEQVLWLSPKRIQRLEYTVWEEMAGRATIPQRCSQIADGYAKRQMDQKREAELESLLQNVVAVNARRNSVVHARWGCKKKNGQVVSRHRIWKGKDHGLHISQFLQLRDDIRNLRDRLGRYPW
jgi:hypothetical protein